MSEWKMNECKASMTEWEVISDFGDFGFKFAPARSNNCYSIMDRTVFKNFAIMPLKFY